MSSHNCHKRFSPAWGWRAASFGLLMAFVVSGCSHSVKAPQTTEVSGKVTYNNKPVPGGVVTFVAVKGGFAGNGTIDENGNYKATSVPVGDVKITVSNKMLSAGRGAPAPGHGPMLGGRPGGEKPNEQKGHYIALPPKYADADTTDLTYTVVSGPQSHDITLK